jgi:putative glycosyltransferase (TIGR04348 family)
MKRPSVVIVSPALAAANNGNWQTARRWRNLLHPHYRSRITLHWPDEDCAGDDFMLALHARRSAAAIQAWAQAKGGQRLAVVLTGTDLYQDIRQDALAQRSLELAGRLVVLQELGVEALPAGHRNKARVIYQSTAARQALVKSDRQLRAVMVGHLRAVKSPETLFEAARLLGHRTDIRIDHIGAASEAQWADLARATERECPSYRWLGEMPHARVRQAIQRAHVLVHTSAMEGGAHVVMEAVRSATPVLASRVPGNVGMVGPDYEGYFEHGQAGQLADLLERCRAGQASSAAAPPQGARASPGGSAGALASSVGVISPASSLLERLRAQCAVRAPLFTAEAERAGLLELLNELQDAR